MGSVRVRCTLTVDKGCVRRVARIYALELELFLLRTQPDVRRSVDKTASADAIDPSALSAPIEMVGGDPGAHGVVGRVLTRIWAACTGHQHPQGGVHGRGALPADGGRGLARPGPADRRHCRCPGPATADRRGPPAGGPGDAGACRLCVSMPCSRARSQVRAHEPPPELAAGARRPARAAQLDDDQQGRSRRSRVAEPARRPSQLKAAPPSHGRGRRRPQPRHHGRLRVRCDVGEGVANARRRELNAGHAGEGLKTG